MLCSVAGDNDILHHQFHDLVRRRQLFASVVAGVAHLLQLLNANSDPLWLKVGQRLVGSVKPDGAVLERMEAVLLAQYPLFQRLCRPVPAH